MNTIIQRAFDLNSNLDESLVIKDGNSKRAIPILWFGDLDAYKHSPIKILTVGINPSDVEFKDDRGNLDLDFRFPGSTAIDPCKVNPQEYADVLNGYFKSFNHPYKWFDRSEAALNGLGASYYDGEEIRAIHIDIRTPVATAQKWRKIGDKTVFEDGIKLFKNLVDELQPDIMIMPLGFEHIKMAWPEKLTWQPIGDGGLKTTKIKVGSKDCTLIKADNSDRGTYRWGKRGFMSENDILDGFSSIKQILKDDGIKLP